MGSFVGGLYKAAFDTCMLFQMMPLGFCLRLSLARLNQWVVKELCGYGGTVVYDTRT